jgi:hypothetical protein
MHTAKNKRRRDKKENKGHIEGIKGSQQQDHHQW